MVVNVPILRVMNEERLVNNLFENRGKFINFINKMIKNDRVPTMLHSIIRYAGCFVENCMHLNLS